MTTTLAHHKTLLYVTNFWFESTYFFFILILHYEHMCYLFTYKVKNSNDNLLSLECLHDACGSLVTQIVCKHTSMDK